MQLDEASAVSEALTAAALFVLRIILRNRIG